MAGIGNSADDLAQVYEQLALGLGVPLRSGHTAADSAGKFSRLLSFGDGGHRQPDEPAIGKRDAFLHAHIQANRRAPVHS